MTEALYLLRHGIAVPHGTPGVEEDDRPLTPEGRRRSRQVARGLRALGVEVDRIVSSPLPRARETARIAAEVLGWDDRLEFADVLRAGSSAVAIAGWLAAREERRLMLVGHDPALSDLIGYLVLGEIRPVAGLRRAGVAALVRPAGATHHVLDWLARPALLRKLGR
jgi:phosphohistidine phosphatase